MYDEIENSLEKGMVTQKDVVSYVKNMNETSSQKQKVNILLSSYIIQLVAKSNIP